MLTLLLGVVITGVASGKRLIDQWTSSRSGIVNRCCLLQWWLYQVCIKPLRTKMSECDLGQPLNANQNPIFQHLRGDIDVVLGAVVATESLTDVATVLQV